MKKKTTSKPKVKKQATKKKDIFVEDKEEKETSSLPDLGDTVELDEFDEDTSDDDHDTVLNDNQN